MLKNHKGLSNIYILDSNGIAENVAPYNENNLGLDHSAYDYFKNTKSEDLVYWSNIFFVSNSRGPLMALSLKSGDRIIVGVLDLEEFGHVVKKLVTDESSIIAVTDSTGAYIAHSNMEYVYLREHDPNYKDFQAFSDGQVRFVEIGIERMIPSVASIGSYNWNAIAYRSRKQLEKQIFYIAITIVIMSLISSIAAIFISGRKTRQISNSISQFVVGTQIISDGRYRYALERSEYQE